MKLKKLLGLVAVLATAGVGYVLPEGSLGGPIVMVEQGERATVTEVLRRLGEVEGDVQELSDQVAELSRHVRDRGVVVDERLTQIYSELLATERAR